MEKFEEIFKLYNKDIYRLAYSYVLNKQDAEDVTQKTFLKLYINIKKLNITNIEFKKWLFRVAINECKNLIKKPWNKIFQNLYFDQQENKRKQTFDISIDEFKNISKKNRISLYLFYYEGFSIKEIAEITKKTEASVKMTLKRGREELKKEMEGNE